MRWLHFSGVCVLHTHTHTCGGFSRPNASQLHPAESDRLNMVSVMEFGETVCVCRDTPGVLQFHSAFLSMYKDSLSWTTVWAHICEKKNGVVYTVRIFPFFLCNGLVHFFSVSVNKGGQKVMPRWKQQRLLLRDDCTALLLLLAFKRHLAFLQTFYESELLLLTGQRW